MIYARVSLAATSKSNLTSSSCDTCEEADLSAAANKSTSRRFMSRRVSSEGVRLRCALRLSSGRRRKRHRHETRPTIALRATQWRTSCAFCMGTAKRDSPLRPVAVAQNINSILRVQFSSIAVRRLISLAAISFFFFAGGGGGFFGCCCCGAARKVAVSRVALCAGRTRARTHTKRCRPPRHSWRQRRQI